MASSRSVELSSMMVLVEQPQINPNRVASTYSYSFKFSLFKSFNQANFLSDFCTETRKFVLTSLFTFSAIIKSRFVLLLSISAPILIILGLSKECEFRTTCLTAYLYFYHFVKQKQNVVKN